MAEENVKFIIKKKTNCYVFILRIHLDNTHHNIINSNIIFLTFIIYDNTREILMTYLLTFVLLSNIDRFCIRQYFNETV